MKEKFFLNGSSEFEPIKLGVITWMPEGGPKKIVHICHGMAEYVARYDAFAEYLNANGIGVIGHDHRQHGESLRENSQVGIFGLEDNWEKVIADVGIVQAYVREQYNVPMVLFGHSMGSVIARNFLQQTDLEFEAVILSGIPNMTKGLWKMGQVLGGLLAKFNPDKPSKFLNNLSVGSFNKKFKNPKTNNDWLSKDHDLCVAYEKDPLCGYAYNPKFYSEMSKGFSNAYDMSHIRRMPKVTTLFVTGSEDPVGKSREDMMRVFEYYQKSGLGDCARQMIFGGLRHEILNEVEKEKVYQFIVNFINQ